MKEKLLYILVGFLFCSVIAMGILTMVTDSPTNRSFAPMEE